MAKSGILGANAFKHNLRLGHNGKLVNPVAIIVIVWLVAIGSLLGVHYSFKKRSRVDINKDGIKKIQAKINSLNDEQKAKAKYFEIGIIELASGELYIVDNGFDDTQINLASGSGLAGKKIEFQVDDPLYLERQMMIREAYKTLNDAEKRCLIDGHATIITDNGAYYLIVDAKIYPDYVIKYGTECRSCGKKQSNQ